MVRESTIEAYLRKAVEGRGGVCWKFKSSVSGVPDRVVMLPEGVIAFLEVEVMSIVLLSKLGTST